MYSNMPSASINLVFVQPPHELKPYAEYAHLHIHESGFIKQLNL